MAEGGGSESLTKHAYLIIHQRDFSKTLGGLHDLEDYYQDERSSIESTKGRTEDLLKNVKSQLEKDVKNAISYSEAKADKLIEEAKKQYTENLLSDYVSQFYKDASKYEKGAIIWFGVLVVAFLITLAFGVHFINAFSIYASPNTGAVIADLFVIPKDKIVNWAALLSAVAPRVIILGLAATVTAFSMKQFRTLKHLEATNRYRATALASFRVFSDTIDETKEGRKRKEKLFDELANLIYSPIQTGYQHDEKLKAAELADLVGMVVKKSSS